jgi:hypothetical protein
MRRRRKQQHRHRRKFLAFYRERVEKAKPKAKD